MGSKDIEELSLNDILENTVKSYDKVLSSHEDVLKAKAQLMENQLALLRKQIHMVVKDLEEVADSLLDSRLYDICRRLKNISLPPSARNTRKVAQQSSRPASMICPSSPRLTAEVKRCSSESQHMHGAVKVRKKSMTIERLEDQHYRARNSVCHVSQRDPKLDYQLSSDMLALQQKSCAKTYGEPERVIRAAITIQRSWRKYCLNRTFNRIKLETPLRTKSMNCKTKPVISVTKDSSSTDSITAVRLMTGSGGESPPTTSQNLIFKRNDAARQIIRTKTNRMISSSSGFSFSQVPVVSQRRNTELSPSSDPIVPHRPLSHSWSNFQHQNYTSRSCPLGERVSGDGAECPDEPSIEADSAKDLPASTPTAERYAALWTSKYTDSEQKQLSRNYKLGVYKFNKRPSQGVKHLTSTNVLDNTPQDIAAFLLNGKGLSLSQIGNFITDLRKPLSMAVLEEFMKQIDFTDLPFEQALRHFISKLRLPGEAQKIDRLMEAFAERYCECNPNMISEAQDTIYVLAFSVIILQTDLHNPQIKLHRKMDLESFVQNNRGIDNGNDLDRKLLEAIYEGVKKEPIISGRDHLDFLESIDKSIIGKKISIMDPSRMLMMTTKMYEVSNRNEKQPPEKHIRHIFLFNDLLLVTKQIQVRGKTTTRTTKERAVMSTCSYQCRQHLMICAFKAESWSSTFYPYGIRISDSYDDRVILELATDKEEDRTSFLEELAEVTWVYRELENDRIGSLGVADKLGQSTLSLHSFNSDTDGGRRHTHTLGRRFFKSNIFKSSKRDALAPSSSMFYTKGISSSDVPLSDTQSTAPDQETT